MFDVACSAGLCGCGCYDRLLEGSRVAAEIRSSLESELGITCCAGIAHNKLLSKLVAGTHKPNQQTTLLPHMVPTLMAGLNSVRSIPGTPYIVRVLQLLIYFGADITQSEGKLNLDALAKLNVISKARLVLDS